MDQTKRSSGATPSVDGDGPNTKKPRLPTATEMEESASFYATYESLAAKVCKISAQRKGLFKDLLELERSGEPVMREFDKMTEIERERQTIQPAAAALPPRKPPPQEQPQALPTSPSQNIPPLNQPQAIPISPSQKPPPRAQAPKWAALALAARARNDLEESGVQDRDEAAERTEHPVEACIRRPIIERVKEAGETWNMGVYSKDIKTPKWFMTLVVKPDNEWQKRRGDALEPLLFGDSKSNHTALQLCHNNLSFAKFIDNSIHMIEAREDVALCLESLGRLQEATDLRWMSLKERMELSGTPGKTRAAEELAENILCWNRVEEKVVVHLEALMAILNLLKKPVLIDRFAELIPDGAELVSDDIELVGSTPPAQEDDQRRDNAERAQESQEKAQEIQVLDLRTTRTTSPGSGEFDDPSYRTVTMSRRLRGVNAMAFLESSVDYEHIKSVHSVSIMDLIAPKVEIAEENEDVQDSAPSVCLSRFESPRIVLEIDTFFWLPLTNCLRFRIHDKKTDKAWQPFVLFFSTTPHDDSDITLHVRSMRKRANKLLDPVLDVLFRAISDTPILEDATVVRGVAYKGFRDDHLSVQDGMVQLYRKRMQKACPELVEYFTK
ncbi:hypothetical protein KFL_010350020 [Klebsormidium nitens]|uniref:Uncharacterized protein n=1 Tax=Klebsormidium nitens TaxID=105231 RepID=A0A1Y1INR2_KLENI|nr:hypothetical protein KFL_010350020 [Klebsormidium nitens]|eukprot:GAQ92510.1 hypothetical protein KFL_010350020 [Klebsormidium nitens]